MTSDPPALGRQRSGSKGGRAARHAAKMRHTNQEEHRRERHLQSSSLNQPSPQLCLEQPIVHPPPPAYPVHHRHQPQDIFDHTFIPNGLPTMPRDDHIQTFSLGNTIDITSLPTGENAMFCDTAGPNPDGAAFDMGQLDWYRLASGLNSGLMTGSNGL